VDLGEIEERVAVVDRAVRPIATRPMSAAGPGPDPLAEAGMADEAPVLVTALLDAYESSHEPERAGIRAVFRRYRYFSWAATEAGPETAGGRPAATAFRRELIHMSALDQGSDTRDMIVALDDVCRRARAQGVDIDPILREVAGMSSTEDRMGMGSSREILLRATGRPGRH
jgi:hypothetical protein